MTGDWIFDLSVLLLFASVLAMGVAFGRISHRRGTKPPVTTTQDADASPSAPPKSSKHEPIYIFQPEDWEVIKRLFPEKFSQAAGRHREGRH